MLCLGACIRRLAMGQGGARTSLLNYFLSTSLCGCCWTYSSIEYLWGLHSTSERVTLHFPSLIPHPTSSCSHITPTVSIRPVTRYSESTITPPLHSHLHLLPNTLGKRTTPPPFGQRITPQPFKRRNRTSLQFSLNPFTRYSITINSTLYCILPRA